MPHTFSKKPQGPRYAHNFKSGFTLMEMIVALAIFTIVLVLATAAFLAVINADRRARATRIASDNLNLTLEDISRRIKTGSVYTCGGLNLGLPNDCSSPSSLFWFVDQSGKRSMYKRGVGNVGGLAGGNAPSACTDGSLPYTATQGCILRSDNNGAAFRSATGPDIDITSLDFRVLGSAKAPDTTQPVVVLSIGGMLGAGGAVPVAFRIQSTITQRLYDN